MNRALYPLLCGTMALGLVGAAPGAEATILTYTFGTEFSGSGGTLSGPVVVTLDDGGGSGSVDVTIDTNGLDGNLSEFVSGLYLNLNPALNPNSLSASFSGADPSVTSVQFGVDAFRPDGDGLYDILISWDEAAGVGRFEADESDLITFTLAGLTASAFDFLSSPGPGPGNPGPFHAALRAQGLGSAGSGSGWFSPTRGFDPGDETLVPEPGSLALFSFGLAGLALVVRRRRKIS